MGMKKKEVQLRHQADSEKGLQNRIAFLSGKGIEAPRIDKDPIVRKWKAEIKQAKNRLRRIADHEKRTEDIAEVKAARVAAPAKEPESAKAGKPKKAPQEAKKKPKEPR